MLWGLHEHPCTVYKHRCAQDVQNVKDKVSLNCLDTSALPNCLGSTAPCCISFSVIPNCSITTEMHANAAIC